MADKKTELRIKKATDDGEVELVGSKESLDQFKFDNSTKNKSIKAKDAAEAVVFETEKAKAEAEKARVSQGIKKRTQLSSVNQERIEKLTLEVLEILEETEAKLKTYDYSNRKTNVSMYKNIESSINSDYDALSDTSSHSFTSLELIELRQKYNSINWKLMRKSIFSRYNVAEISFYLIPILFIVISIILIIVEIAG